MGRIAMGISTRTKHKQRRTMTFSLAKTFAQFLAMSAVAQAGYNRKYWQQVYNARKAAMVSGDEVLMGDSNSIIIDTRTAEEREEYDFEAIANANGMQYIVVDYDNFYKADRFFHSFIQGSEYYNSENDGQDIDIFGLPEDFDFSAKPLDLPADAAAVGEDITLICGKRSCGCRWSLMYNHGIRGHSYLNTNVNNFIDTLNDE